MYHFLVGGHSGRGRYGVPRVRGIRESRRAVGRFFDEWGFFLNRWLGGFHSRCGRYSVLRVRGTRENFRGEDRSTDHDTMRQFMFIQGCHVFTNDVASFHRTDYFVWRE